jgi:nucleoside-diphosphate-sugar epimerase
MFLGVTGLRLARCAVYERYEKRHEERKIRAVLVIGGAGYIGSALIPKLLNKGYRVRVLDLFLYGHEAIQEVLDHPRLEIMQADFRRVEKVVDAMRNMDAVIHLGALVGDPACALDEDLTIEINLMATRMIAEVAKGCGVSRFIFASTCSVYGMSDEMLDERSPLNPVSLYARSKIASEQVLMTLADPSFAPTFLRFGTIYGLSGRTRFDLVLNLLAAKAVVDGEITVMGGGQWRPFLHVDDAALAVFKALEAPLPVVRNQIFNVGSEEQNHTIQQVGEIIHRLVPTARLINMGSDSDQRNYRVSFSKIRKSLDFSPRWTIEQGVQQVIAALACGVVKDYRDAKHSNIKFLSEESNVRLMPQNRWAYELINGGSPAVEQGSRHLQAKSVQAS